MVIIIDTAFCFSLFYVFFFHSCPLFLFCVIKSVGLSAVMLLVCLINALDLSIAKLYVMKNLNLNMQQIKVNLSKETVLWLFVYFFILTSAVY